MPAMLVGVAGLMIAANAVSSVRDVKIDELKGKFTDKPVVAIMFY